MKKYKLRQIQEINDTQAMPEKEYLDIIKRSIEACRVIRTYGEITGAKKNINKRIEEVLTFMNMAQQCFSEDYHIDFESKIVEIRRMELDTSIDYFCPDFSKTTIPLSWLTMNTLQLTNVKKELGKESKRKAKKYDKEYERQQRILQIVQ